MPGNLLIQIQIGTAFVDVLVRKAQEGLVVKLVLDWYGCRNLKKSDHYQRLVDAGVQMRFAYADWQVRPLSQKLSGWIFLPFKHYL